MIIGGIFLKIWSAIGFIAFLILFLIPAPYGKFTKKSSKYLISSRVGWLLMELPTSLISLIFIFYFFNSLNLLQLFLLFLWNIHYIHRGLIWPFRAKIGHKKMSFSVVLLAFAFNIINSTIQSYWIIFIGSYENITFSFVLGFVLFSLGMYINIRSDNILIALRNDKEDYAIPKGFLFNKITSPNYFGESIEWLGWALLTFNLAGLAFFAWTVFNLLPRSISTHKWYLKKFKEYPKDRKIFLPYIY